MATRYINGKAFQVKDSSYARICPHNEGVLCESMKCVKCGWNPKVEKARRERNGKS